MLIGSRFLAIQENSVVNFFVNLHPSISYELATVFTFAFFSFLALWLAFWKGWALWIAAGKKQKIWFVLLLVVNTLGFLEIGYIIYQKSLDKKKIVQH